MKGQTWSIDYIIGLFLFVIAVVLSIQLITTTATNPQFDDTRRDAERISEVFIAQGMPTFWNNMTVIRPGLFVSGKINDTQVGQLMKLNYNTTKNLLNVQEDFFIAFINTSDGKTPVFINASCGYGDPTVDISVSTSGGPITSCDGGPCTGGATACTGTQSTCNGTGKSCTGTYGACLGTATPCWLFEQQTGNCFIPPSGPQIGCMLDINTNLCAGTAAACSSFGTNSACRRQAGCYWVTCGNYSSSNATCTAPPHNTTCTYNTCASYTTNPTSCTALTGCSWYNCTFPAVGSQSACESRFNGAPQCVWKTCADFTNDPAGCTNLGCSAPVCGTWDSDQVQCEANGCTYVIDPNSGPLQGSCVIDMNTVGENADQIVKIDRLARYSRWTGTEHVDDVLTVRFYVWQ